MANRGSAQRLPGDSSRVLLSDWVATYMLEPVHCQRLMGKLSAVPSRLPAPGRKCLLAGNWKATSTAIIIQTLLFEDSVPHTWAPGFLSHLT